MPQKFDWSGLPDQGSPASVRVSMSSKPALFDWSGLPDTTPDDPNRKPARAEDFMEPEPEGSVLGRFASNAWDMVNPVPLVKAAGSAVVGAVTDPLGLPGRVADTVGGVIGAQVAQGRKALDLAREGRYSEAAGHGAAALLPIVGPVAAGVGEQIGKGDIAGGLGAATGLLTGVVAPGAIAKVAPKVVGGLFKNPNPVAAEAVEAGIAAGVPMDAATATGNRFVAGVQHMADRTAGGAGIAGRAAQAQSKGLATMGEQLAAKGHPAAITAEAAGEGVTAAVRGKVGEFAAQADEAYEALRTIEADPKHARMIAPTVKPGSSAAAMGAEYEAAGGRFAKTGASIEDLFQGVLGDARRSGFTGSADDLKAALADEIRSAKELGASMAEANATGPLALLADIRKYGGIKPFELDTVRAAGAGSGPLKPRLGLPAEGSGGNVKLRGEFANAQQAFAAGRWQQRGGAQVFRNEGLGLDEMVGRLRQDPKWQGLIDENADLVTALEDIARKGPDAQGVTTDLEHLMGASGVTPGSQWWSKVQGAGAQEIALPVNLTGFKAQIKPVYDRLMRESEIAGAGMMGDKARALVALDHLMRGADHASLSVVDAALGDLKSFVRAGSSEVKTAGQGVVGGAVKHLDAIVQKVAADAGPEAIAALKRGRQATIEKYAAGDILDALNKEPVRAYRQGTSPRDTAIVQLREIAKLAPAELPKIGRAFLDDLLTQATNDGGFAKAGTVANKWEALGPETKRLLFKDAQHVKELDQFFRLAKAVSANANPSGTASATAAATQAAALATSVGTLNPVAFLGTLTSVVGVPMAVSKFLHSPAGVRLLTKGFKIPVGSKAAKAAYASELSNFLEKSTASNPSGSQRQDLVPVR